MNSVRRKITYVVFALCGVACVAAAAFSIVDRRDTAARAAYDALEQEAVSERMSSHAASASPAPVTVYNEGMDEEEPEPEEKAEAEEQVHWDGEGADLTVDFDKLVHQNADTIGWIEIPAIGASYPLLYYPDSNDYYINRSFEGYYSDAGVIYLECTNNPDLSDPNSLIYGHNMGDGSMFGNLHRLQSDDSLYTEHPYFYIYKTDGTVNRYRIFSYYQTQKGSLTYSRIDNEDGYRYYSGMAMELSQRRIDVSFDGMPPIVTLSTCHGGAGTTKRFAVHGVLEGTCVSAETEG